MSVFSVCVYCGSRSGNKPIFEDQAKRLGDFIAHEAWRLVYGAGDVGLMGTVARATQSGGAATFGVIPTHLMDMEVRRARIVYQASQQKFQISKKLSKLQGISQEDLILDELELASALADLDLATNAVSRCELQAPFDGYISKIHVEKFSVAEAQRPFISLVDPSSGWVDFVASTADNISVQDPVTLVLDNGHTILARVTSSSPVIDPVSQTRDFRVRLDPTPENIFPGIVLMVESAN